MMIIHEQAYLRTALDHGFRAAFCELIYDSQKFTPLFVIDHAEAKLFIDNPVHDFAVCL